ncbi:MAG TPA: flagellar biosynthesis protein FliQ [Clostridia bacterium]|nr:flagellar biosynthesis protein FliQ [Clostridia bacterium]
MSQGDVISICKDAVITALLLSAPFLIVSIVIGVIISVFQAATQIHEQTIAFVPKLLAIALVLIFLGSWMINVMVDFTQKLFGSINSLM